MKICALLSWYDESPSWLAATVASMRGLVSHVVAIDGAYALFPQAHTRPNSGPDQADAISRAAHACGMGSTVIVPAEPFYGNEVEKRTLLFQAGALVTTAEDWYLIIDADEVVTAWSPEIHAQLAAAEEDVAGAYFWTRTALHPLPVDQRRDPARVAQLEYEGAPPPVFDRSPTVEGYGGHRVLLRALRDLRVERAHYIYVAGPVDAPRYLRAEASFPQEPLLDVEVSIEHRHDYRRADRNSRGSAYYDRRDRTGIERVVNTYLETPAGDYRLQGPGRAGH